MPRNSGHTNKEDKLAAGRSQDEQQTAHLLTRLYLSCLRQHAGKDHVNRSSYLEMSKGGLQCYDQHENGASLPVKHCGT